MHKILRLITCAGLLAASAAASATAYQFTYTLGSGDVLSGSFDGTASGNLINNLSNISATFKGYSFPNNGQLLNYGYNTASGAFTLGTGVASFDGLANNFQFASADINGSIPYAAAMLLPYAAAHTDTAFIITTEFNGEGAGFADEHGNPIGAYSAARWQIAAVPEPATYGMMLGGMGLLALAKRRRDNNGRA
jgi:hypothetical protein